MDDLQLLLNNMAHDIEILNEIADQYEAHDRELTALEQDRLRIIGLIEAGDEESLEQVRNYFAKQANQDS